MIVDVAALALFYHFLPRTGRPFDVLTAGLAVLGEYLRKVVAGARKE